MVHVGEIISVYDDKGLDILVNQRFWCRKQDVGVIGETPPTARTDLHDLHVLHVSDVALLLTQLNMVSDII